MAQTVQDQIDALKATPIDHHMSAFVDELLTMPEGWILGVIRRAPASEGGAWYCVLSHKSGMMTGTNGCESALSAIRLAKARAERNTL